MQLPFPDIDNDCRSSTTPNTIAMTDTNNTDGTATANNTATVTSNANAPLSLCPLRAPLPSASSLSRLCTFRNALSRDNHLARGSQGRRRAGVVLRARV